MRSVRILVLASLPVLVCGGVVRVASVEESPPRLALGVFAAAGAALVLVCGAVIVVGDAARLARHPLAVTVVALGALVGASSLDLWSVNGDAYGLGAVWLEAGVTTAAGTALLLLAIVLVRALVAMWRDSDLPLWPGHRVACVALVTAALAAAPVAVPRRGFEPALVVPALERAWQPIGLHDEPGWTYYDPGSGLL
jgi:hypothetical protein